MIKQASEKWLTYKPIKFIVITFVVTWVCAFFSGYQTMFDYSTILGWTLLTFINFIQSASPLLAALILLRHYLFADKKFLKYVFGSNPKMIPCLVVVLLFAFQFFTFYFFGLSKDEFSISKFLSILGVQILLGGGLEEGGWRGYLQPALEKKFHVAIAVIIVSLIWVMWHLPYFFLPGNHQGTNFLMYTLTCVAISFALTAIHKLTKSVLICTLFHGLVNTLAIGIGANFKNNIFVLMVVSQTIFSIVLCLSSDLFILFPNKKHGNF